MDKIISFYNDDGSLKSKTELLDNVSEIYDSISNGEGPTFYDMVTDPELNIDPVEVLTTFDFNNRTLYITKEITSAMADDFFQIVNFWNVVDNKDNNENPLPIKVYINTPGGEIDAVLSIISTIKASTTPVYTIITGTGYSGGFLIGISGHKRFCLQHSSFLFHEGAAALGSSDAHKLIQEVDFYKFQLEKLKSIVLENTKITEQEYNNHKKDDWFFDAETALQYGIIDEIITKI